MSLKYLREMKKAPFEIIRNLYQYRHILMQMVIREIKGRFAGSVGGILWNFAHPIFMLIVYLFVFVYIFKLRLVTGGGAGASAIYIMAGLFPWVILAEGLSRGTTSLIENANLIQKTPFPTEILPAKAVFAPFLGHGIAIVLLTLYTVVFSSPTVIIFVLPFLIISQILFTLGIAFITATLTVFFRDVMQFVNIIISFWIYLTPIVYPVDMLPQWARKAMYFNPFFPFVSLYQAMFVGNAAGQWIMILLSFLWSICFFVIGAFLFNKLKYEFADWL